MTERAFADTDKSHTAAQQGAKEGKSLSQQAYKALTEAIRSRKLEGGQVIVEGKVSEMLGISRTPMREALQRLEGERLVVKAAYQPYTVRKVDFAEYMQSLKLRELLETEAAALSVGKVPKEEIDAARREILNLNGVSEAHTDAHWHSDDTVHSLIVRHSGNAVLASIVDALRVTTRLFELSSLEDRIQADALEHRAIVEGLATGDAKAAKRAVQKHIRGLQKHALKCLAQ